MTNIGLLEALGQSPPLGPPCGIGRGKEEELLPSLWPKRLIRQPLLLPPANWHTQMPCSGPACVMWLALMQCPGKSASSASSLSLLLGNQLLGNQ